MKIFKETLSSFLFHFWYLYYWLKTGNSETVADTAQKYEQSDTNEKMEEELIFARELRLNIKHQNKKSSKKKSKRG